MKGINEDLHRPEFQVEFYKMAKARNSILYLPPGCETTCIFVMLLHDLNSQKESDIFKPIADGGSRSFVIVNEVLVENKAKVIETLTPLNVGKYTSLMGVNQWSCETWIKQIDTHQIIVTTSEILLDLIQNVISFTNIFLLVFEECHKAMETHPMNEIVKQLGDFKFTKPRVLGLTSALVSGKDPKKVEEEVRKLETAFGAQLITSSNPEVIQLYTRSTCVKTVSYKENNIKDCRYQTCRLQISRILTALYMLKNKCIHSSQPTEVENIGVTFEILKNLVGNAMYHIELLGLFGGHLALHALTVELTQLSHNFQLPDSRTMYQCAIAGVNFLSKYINEVNKGDMTMLDYLQHCSSHQVKRLLEIMKQVKGSSSAIVVVRETSTAKIICDLLNKASEIDPDLQHVKAAFIADYTKGNPLKCKADSCMQKELNIKATNLFNKGLLNVLVVSSLVEDGVESAKSSHVIMFDHLHSFQEFTEAMSRGKDEKSQFLFFIPENSTQEKLKKCYKKYILAEKALKELLIKKIASAEMLEKASLLAKTPGIRPNSPRELVEPSTESTIFELNMYFDSLKPDLFTKCNYAWEITKDNDGKFLCSLRFPLDAKVQGTIQGIAETTVAMAKRSAALESHKLLASSEEINNSFPFIHDQRAREAKEEDEENKTILVNKKWPECLTSCRPGADEPVYLHVLETKPVYPVPSSSTNRLHTVYNTLCGPNSFALISSKQLPELASFPLFTSTGEMEARVHSFHKITLSNEQRVEITKFNHIIFNNVLGCAKTFMIRDITNNVNSLLIAPVIIVSEKEVEIDWSVMKEASRPFPRVNVRLSPESRSGLTFTDEQYLGKIVSPWYRPLPAQKYLVTKVCHDMSEESPFPTENYSTYEDYFEDKYKIKPMNFGQPLLEVRAVSSNLNCTKPRIVTKEPWRKKQKEENEDFEVWLIPEFCVVYPLPGSYWIKAVLLPSMLHRITQLCLAEELHGTVGQEIGALECSPCPPIDWMSLKEDKALTDKKDQENKKPQALVPLDMKSPLLLETDQNFIDCSLSSSNHFDVLCYSCSTDPSASKESSPVDVAAIEFAPPESRFAIEMSTNARPRLVEVLQALTSEDANDLFNGKRHSILGGSFLQFIVSLGLFKTPSVPVHRLESQRELILGESNLLFAAKRNNILGMLEVQEFAPEEWVPPGYCVPSNVVNTLLLTGINPSCLYLVEIPEEERLNATISAETNTRFEDVLFDGEDIMQYRNCTITNRLALTEKQSSDAVKALIGVYLTSCGILGALSVVKWFEMMDDTLCGQDVLLIPVKTCTSCDGDGTSLLRHPQLLEDIIEYRFQDRLFLLEALTHPSFTCNNYTRSFQRLQFLGSAILDFLITVHIFDEFSSLAQLRWAVVNNITFACVVARSKLYKFLLHLSPSLDKAIMVFVRCQEVRNHTIDNTVLCLVEERDVDNRDAVDVPKALSDVFKALVAAVYLDSGNDLNVVWKMVHNLLRKEIDTFGRNTPQDHETVLNELCNPYYSYCGEVNGVHQVSIDVPAHYESKQIKLNGFGSTEIQARQAAAKRALRKVLGLSLMNSLQ